MNANKQDAGGLLPWPFCATPEPRRFMQPDEHGRPSYGVQCTSSECAACGPEGGSVEAGDAAWNRRNGEQCRAASGDFEDADDFANHLEQEIRRVDGNHSLSASALADAVTPFILRALSRGVPEGMVLVPRVPTESMCDAPAERGWAWKNEDEFSADDAESVYRAMIEAAIAAQRKEGE